MLRWPGVPLHIPEAPHAAGLKAMDKLLFSPVPMNLRADLDAKARGGGLGRRLGADAPKPGRG